MAYLKDHPRESWTLRLKEKYIDYIKKKYPHIEWMDIKTLEYRHTDTIEVYCSIDYDGVMEFRDFQKIYQISKYFNLPLTIYQINGRYYTTKELTYIRLKNY